MTTLFPTVDVQAGAGKWRSWDFADVVDDCAFMPARNNFSAWPSWYKHTDAATGSLVFHKIEWMNDEPLTVCKCTALTEWERVTVNAPWVPTVTVAECPCASETLKNSAEKTRAPVNKWAEIKAAVIKSSEEIESRLPRPAQVVAADVPIVAPKFVKGITKLEDLEELYDGHEYEDSIFAGFSGVQDAAFVTSNAPYILDGSVDTQIDDFEGSDAGQEHGECEFADFSGVLEAAFAHAAASSPFDSNPPSYASSEEGGVCLYGFDRFESFERQTPRKVELVSELTIGLQTKTHFAAWALQVHEAVMEAGSVFESDSENDSDDEW